MMIKRGTFIAGAFCCLVLLSACVDFNIINVSAVNARILIQTPDGGRHAKVVKSGGSTGSFSEHGGSYTISILPDEQYLALLRELRQEITRRLFEERETLSADDVARLVQRLEEIEEQLEKESQRGVSCSGVAPDFSSVNAVISWSDFDGEWSIDCAVDTAEE
jgi:hypothetical protein